MIFPDGRLYIIIDFSSPYFPSEVSKQVKYIGTRVIETQQETWDKRQTENNSKYLLVHLSK